MAVVEGCYADINIIELDAVKDNTTYLTPRIKPAGFKYVLVNGSIVVEDGKHTGALPGRFIKYDA